MSVARFKFKVDFGEGEGPVFYRWLPGESEKICIEKDGLKIEAAFPLESARTSFMDEIGDISNWVNVSTHFVQICVTVEDLHVEFVEILALPADERPSHPNFDLFEELYIRIYINVTSLINRLISFCRSKKNQYWLEEIKVDKDNLSSFYVRSSAEISIDGGAYKRFIPTHSSSIVLYDVDDGSYIREGEWHEFQEFLLSESRPPLIGFMIAKSWELLVKEHRRSSLIEAVVALELTLSEISDAKFLHLLPENLSGRFRVGQRKKTNR